MISCSEIVYTNDSPDTLYTKMCYAEEEGAFIAHIRGKLCSTVLEFFREISAAMRFPDYFGWNWAAFDECITDLSWLKFNSLLIVITDFNSLFRDEKRIEETKMMLEKYLNIAVLDWSMREIPINIIINDYPGLNEGDLTDLYFEEKRKDKSSNKKG